MVSFLVEFTDNQSSEMISSPLLPLLTFLALVEHMVAIPTIVQTLSSRLYNVYALNILIAFPLDMLWFWEDLALDIQSSRRLR